MGVKSKVKKGSKVCRGCGRHGITEHHPFRQSKFNFPTYGIKKNGNGKVYNGDGKVHNGNGNPFVMDLCVSCHQDRINGISQFLNKKEADYEAEIGQKITKEEVYSNLAFYVKLYLTWHMEFFEESEQEILSWINTKGRSSLDNKILNNGTIKNKEVIIEYFTNNFYFFNKEVSVNDSSSIFKRIPNIYKNKAASLL